MVEHMWGSTCGRGASVAREHFGGEAHVVGSMCGGTRVGEHVWWGSTCDGGASVVGEHCGGGAHVGEHIWWGALWQVSTVTGEHCDGEHCGRRGTQTQGWVLEILL